MKTWFPGCFLLLLAVVGCPSVPGPLPEVTLCQRHSDCRAVLRCFLGVCVDQEGYVAPGEALEEPPLDGGTESKAEPGAELGPDSPGADSLPELECTNDQTKECYEGPAGTQDKRPCKAGSRLCVNGKWGECKDQVRPAPKELCDGLDNNCNGVIDEGCSCYYDNKRRGVCTLAVRDQKGVCLKPSAYNASDDCSDNIDNNCDGVVNDGCDCIEGDERSCGMTKGACVAGKQVCDSMGVWGAECKGAKTSKPEICDRIDNDCDGITDENCPCDFKEGKGVCSNAKTDTKGVCRPPASYTFAENCRENADNNCDGVTNEGCNCFFLGKTKGVCGVARNNQAGVCQKPGTYKATEICNDGLDNNCNGIIDEGCPCLYKNINEGVCKTARIAADGKCAKPAKYSEREICGDGFDNDCDKRKDFFGAPSVCYTHRKACTDIKVSPPGPTDVCITSIPRCRGTMEECSPLSGGSCTTKTDVVRCNSHQDCNKCNGNNEGFSCHFKSKLCYRRSTLTQP